MKKKNILYTLYAAAFIGICLAPAVLMPVSGKDKGASLENRTLSSMPKLTAEEGGFNFEFFSEFETYFSEHFAFRSELVTLDGKIKSELFSTSSDEDVIVGKDGWLYYTPTAGDYMNTEPLSSRAINNIHHNLSLLNDYCESVGATFTFAPAPNKNSVYPEYMPSNFIVTDQADNLDRLWSVYEAAKDEWLKLAASSFFEDSLKAQELYPYYFCDLKKALLEAKENSDLPVYHKTDTHWNNIGALAARNALLDGKWSNQWTVRNDWSGDLAEMIYPADVPLDNQYYLDYDFGYEYVGRFRGLDDINIKTTSENAKGSLLMYRDSFGEAILPFMAESFAEAEFSRAVPYNTASIKENMTVILEIVERNLGDLQKYAPIMPAPVYEGELTPTGKSSEAAIEVVESGEYYHIFGELGESFFKDDNARIFVTVGDTTYEAFNCFEDKLLEREGEINDNGLSLYIPKDSVTLDELRLMRISVLSGNGEIIASEY